MSGTTVPLIDLVLGFGILVCLAGGAVAWANAHLAGQCWTEAAHLGGAIRTLVVLAAIDSAAAFTLIVYVVALSVTVALGLLPPRAPLVLAMPGLLALIDMGGAVLILALLGWIGSGREIRLRELADRGLLSTTRLRDLNDPGFLPAPNLDDVTAFFRGDSDGLAAGLLAWPTAIAVSCLGFGLYFTWEIALRSAGTLKLPDLSQDRASGQQTWQKLPNRSFGRRDH